MGHTYTDILIHAVFSTKHREPHLTPNLRSRLHPYMGGIVRELDGCAHIVSGTADHVHLLVSLPPKRSLSDVMRILKSNSSRWLRDQMQNRVAFAWQTGYSAFTVSHSNLEAVRKYIADQEEHHRKISFQDEVRALLRKHGIEFDEQYLWD